MSGSQDHGLKDLFGSVPDAGDEDPSAPPASSPPVPQPSAPAKEGHGLAGLTPTAPQPPEAPSAPPPAAPAPLADAPTIQGVPSAPIPQAPAPVTDGVTDSVMDAGTAPASVPGPAAQAARAPLAVVLLARGDLAPLTRSLDALRGQTAAGLVDVIVVGAGPDAEPGAAPDRGDLASLTLLPAADGETDGQRAARGVEAAGGDLVAILDDYAFPATDWAETVLTHRHEGFGALASGLGNANPRSKHSWSHMLLEYGPWREGASGGEVAALPARNLVFRRETLTALPDLAALLDQDGALARALAARGHALRHDPQARLAVLNPSRLGDTLRARYAAGRLDAAGWREGLSAPKRTAKALRAALGGYARYKRDRSRLFSGDAAVNPKQHGGALALAMMTEGVGRAMGFLAGPGDAARVRGDLTSRRLKTLNKTDRRQFASRDG